MIYIQIEHRMARLADTVLRSFPSRTERLDCLFQYLNTTGESSLANVHPDILSLFEIHEHYLVL